MIIFISAENFCGFLFFAWATVAGTTTMLLLIGGVIEGFLERKSEIDRK